MLKKCFIIIPLLFCLLLSGCGIVLNELISDDKEDDGYQHPYNIARDTRNEVLRCVEENDAIGISDLFSQSVPVSSDDIQELLDLIEGEIISIETEGIHGGVAKSENGRYTYYTYAASITVYTDIDNKYLVNIAGTAICDDNPSVIGIERFRIYDLQTDEMNQVGLG